jgi:hypothetical protein
MYKMKQLKNIGGGVRIMDNYGITPLSTIFKLYCGSLGGVHVPSALHVYLSDGWYSNLNPG